jgi:Protein of unknown function (DUF4058)
MPSPFPGMDPYLEDPNGWANVHHGIIAALQAALNAIIRPKYYARIAERVYLCPADELAPESFVVLTAQPAGGRPRRSRRAGRGLVRRPRFCRSR